MCVINEYDFSPYLEIGERIKTIEHFPDYYITNYGNVYSTKRGYPHKLALSTDSRGLYLIVRLCGITHKTVLVHRLVAQAFVPNPNNLPEVNHKDKNTQNPKASNLEWCTRRENLEDSYETMSPTRNYNTCKLYKNNELLGEFQSIRKACKFAKEQYNINTTSLEKYLRCGEYYLETQKETRKTLNDGTIHSTQNRNPIQLLKKDQYVATFKSYSSVRNWIINNEGHCSSETSLRKYKKYNDYTLIRDS